MIVQSTRLDQRLMLTYIGFAVIFTQRLAIPVGQFGTPLSNIGFLLVALVFSIDKRFRISPTRSIIFLAMVITAITTTIVTHSEVAPLALLIVYWIPSILAVFNSFEAQRAFLAGVTIATIVGSGLALVQSLVSATLGMYPDPLTLLPQNFTVGGYNTASPVSFSSPIMKSNGMIFLEPSFMSLFAVLGLLFLLSGAAGNTWNRHTRRISITLLVLGFALSVSSSGLLIMPFLILTAIRKGLSNITKISLLGGLAGLTLFRLPSGKSVFYDVFSLSPEAGSTPARIVRPYTEILMTWVHQGPWYGYGPGTSHLLATSLYSGWQTEVTTPTLVKLLYEYGVPGLVATIALAALVLKGCNQNWCVRGALVIALFVPTDGLASGPLSSLITLSAIAGISTNVDLPRSPLFGGSSQSALAEGPFPAIHNNETVST